MEAACSYLLLNPCSIAMVSSSTTHYRQDSHVPLFQSGAHRHPRHLLLSNSVSASVFYPSDTNSVKLASTLGERPRWRRRLTSTSLRCSTAGDSESMWFRLEHSCIAATEDVKVIQPVVALEGSSSPQRMLYLVDVHPLCYEGKKPRPRAILNWMELLFNQVSLAEPVIAVMDGERGNDYRKGLLPGYKEKRNKFRPLTGTRGPYFKGDQMDLREAFPHIKSFLTECNVPVLKVEDAEADDVIATLTQQAVNRGMRVVVASPDMDYRQLLSENVKMVLPLPKMGRWSFYTLQQYVAEHECDPSADLGLRCMLGDQTDNVPGLQEWSPGFGRKTAVKLMKKHGSLESLLLASKTRTVGKPYIQDALAKYRDALQRNLQVLSLRRDLDIPLRDEWLTTRDRSNEAQAFSRLREILQGRRSYARS